MEYSKKKKSYSSIYLKFIKDQIQYNQQLNHVKQFLSVSQQMIKEYLETEQTFSWLKNRFWFKLKLYPCVKNFFFRFFINNISFQNTRYWRNFAKWSTCNSSFFRLKKYTNSCCLNKGQIKTVNYNSSHSIWKNKQRICSTWTKSRIWRGFKIITWIRSFPV